ncbi:MAG: hypothetical protein KBG15_03540 [Kofleriaceae bacterium]|nr:hypothetical protein [Kofleriaceae bacterium]
MKKIFAAILLAAAVTGCGPKHASFVKAETAALGRVVVYRNGVAFYERKAVVTGGSLTVSVPRERVDDFLKSLTVTDASNHRPLPVSIPREQTENDGYLVMKLQLPSNAPTNVLLTYVTEAPAWKPSYRVVVGAKGKVMLEGWAIVDNTSGEDWKGVLVGVGSSSALSFRYDLWSVRQVQREMLANGEMLAVAPPTGGSPFSTTPGASAGDAVLADFADDEIRRPDGHPENSKSRRMAEESDNEAAMSAPAPVIAAQPRDSKKNSRSRPGSKTPMATPPSPSADTWGGAGRGASAATKSSKVAVRDSRASVGDQKMANISTALINGTQTIEIQAYANANQVGADRRASDRANIVRNQLIDRGVAPSRIKVVTNVAANVPDKVRLVAVAQSPAEQQAAKAAKNSDLDAPPVGESHFDSDVPMTVNKGSSVMVSMVRKETEGEVVYLYDAESARGNDRFAFKAVRLRNPTDSTLETGPVTVYGQERFIGEGLTEPIPPNASVVVPFALDRQIIVDRDASQENRISRLVTLQRGILTAEVQHIKRTKLTITSRLPTPSKLFLRHSVGKGWTLIDSPKSFERLGDAHLFAIDLAPNQQKTIEIAEATPMERTMDLSADVTLDMLKLFVNAPEMTVELKGQLTGLLAIHREVADMIEREANLRKKLNDYRERMDELHVQLVSLQLVKTGGDLLSHLRAKMKDISDRVQKTTIEVVDTEEKIMLARIRFADALAELSLTDATKPAK